MFENLIDLKKQYRFESEISVPFARKQILQLIRMAATNNESKSQNTPKNKGNFIMGRLHNATLQYNIHYNYFHTSLD